jgi:hypothetical protein
MEKEEWKPVKNYEGLYEVSSLGRVKSLRRNKVMNVFFDSRKYIIVSLRKDSIKKTFRIHSLVAESFLNHVRNGKMDLVIDHINDNPSDNKVENLQIITQRENSCKTQGNYSSKYKGVCWYSRDKRWVSKIYIDKKTIVLGYFKCELAAHLAYQNKLKTI